MPNIFRSKHKQSSSPTGPIRGPGPALPAHPSVSVANRPTPAKDNGLPSPPRSPEPQSATSNPGSSAYFDRLAGHRGSIASSQNMHSDSTLASGMTTTTSGSRHVSSSAASVGASVGEAGDRMSEMDMNDGTRGGHRDSHHPQHLPPTPKHQIHHHHHPQQHQPHHQPHHQPQQQQPTPQQQPPYYQQSQPAHHQQPPTPHAHGLPQHPKTASHVPVPALLTAYTMQPTPSTTQTNARKSASRYALADFAMIRTLGTGSFGRVHLAKSRHNGRSYAIKVLSKERVVKMKQVEHTNSEREMLERVRHPFLVNLWGTFVDPNYLYMVMDFVAGGELFSLLRKSQRFPDPVAKFFGAEVALGLHYLHSMDIIYRDLKPENILLCADGHIKITDFGFAKHVPDITWTLCGTPDYLAPEIVQSKGYNKSVDWYALGVLIFEMLAGYPPFFTEDSNPMKLYEKIIAGTIRYPSYFSPPSKDLLKSLLTADLTKRFGNLAKGSRDVFAHAWFAEVDWDRLYRKEIPAPFVPKVEGDGDASNFDQYPEVDVNEYGQRGPDPHGELFPSF